ncbi:MAG: ribosome assembly cofactor RimP [Mucilaginibacter polytrichastri]|nr:ribosome assembly cofactor RimP [Mucilaginibacter polytrichastri]
MTVEQQVETWLSEWLAERPDLFPVKIQLSGKKLTVLLDGDNGITIQDCSRASRMLGQKLEENENLIDYAYTLEVSSPGADEPFRNQRQYGKNIGRKVLVKLTDGRTAEGKLVGANGQGIDIEQEIKEKGKKKYTENSSLLFDDIMETKIILSFK